MCDDQLLVVLRHSFLILSTILRSQSRSQRCEWVEEEMALVLSGVNFPEFAERVAITAEAKGGGAECSLVCVRVGLEGGDKGFV